MARVRQRAAPLSDSSDSGSESVIGIHRSRDQVGAATAGNAAAPASVGSSQGGLLSGAGSLAGRLVHRACTLFGGGARSSTMEETKSGQEQQVMLAERRPQPEAGGFGLLTIPLWLWIPSSASILEDAEAQCFRYVKSQVKRELVRTDDGHTISTVTIRGSGDVQHDINHPPVVLLHGFAGGAGIWCKNVDALASDRVVYAIDIIGFGRSSRPQFTNDPQEIEELFVSALESWRRTVSLPSFILVGHSLGGYIAGVYALKHSSRVEHLVLVDCWGVPERPENLDEHRILIPKWVRVLRPIVNMFNPLSALRAAGPFGAMMLRTIRPDLQKKYREMFDDNTVPNYIYHCNAQSQPTGEMAMKSLSIPFGWAKNPLFPRLAAHLDTDVPMTLLYGERSWVDSRVGYQLQEVRESSYVDVRIVSHAGHHIYSDQSDKFNKIMVEVCTRVTDHLTSSSSSDDDE